MVDVLLLLSVSCFVPSMVIMFCVFVEMPGLCCQASAAAVAHLARPLLLASFMCMNDMWMLHRPGLC